MLGLFLFTACVAPNPVLQTVHSLQAPAAIGPYSQGIVSGEFLFLSGQIALDPATGALVAGDVAAQTHRALENVRAVLAAGGCGPADVVKTTVFLLDMNDFAVMNEIYAAFFAPHKPARSTVQVARLPKDAKIEIECIARIPR
jgi:2-iminobutanoate/2-iminopropanoate deaminase